MNVVLHIPDTMATRLTAEGGDLARQALEALAVEGFRAGWLTKKELRQALGFEVLDEVDGFLKKHGVFESYPPAELYREVEALARLGF